MKTIAVIYQSKYGATEQYAKWIATALDAALFEKSEIKPSQLLDFDVVVYGGGLYASGIRGLKLVTNNPCNQLVVFTVGIANPETTDYSDILTKNFKTEQLSKTKVFHLRGGIDYKKLGFIHKNMMAMLKKMLDKKSEEEKTEEDKALLETFGSKVDFVDQSTINPIVEYVKSI